MQSTDAPAKFPIAFASAANPAYIQQVPTTYNSAVPGSFGLDVGSPPETFLDPASGGIAPLGEYFNGLMNQITAWIRWQQSGGVPSFDSAQCTAIGGYPKGAILKAASYGAFWVSTAENNFNNPDGGTLTSPSLNWAVLQPGTYPWTQITGKPANILTTSSFTTVNGPNGYREYPDGGIDQWCEQSSGPSTIITINYPITFPHTCNRPRVTATNPSATTGGVNNFVGATLVSYTLSSCRVAVGSIPVGSTTVVTVDVRGS